MLAPQRPPGKLASEVMRAAELIVILTFLAAETAGPASHSTVELSLHMGLASEVIPMA